MLAGFAETFGSTRSTELLASQILTDWLRKCSLGFMCSLCLCMDLSCTWNFPVCSLLVTV